MIPFLFQNNFNVNNVYNLFCDYYDNNSFYKEKYLAFSEELKIKINTKHDDFNYNLYNEIINLID